MLSLYKEMSGLPGRKVKSMCPRNLLWRIEKSLQFLQSKMSDEARICRLLLPYVFVVYRCESSVGVFKGCSARE